MHGAYYVCLLIKYFTCESCIVGSSRVLSLLWDVFIVNDAIVPLDERRIQHCSTNQNLVDTCWSNRSEYYARLACCQVKIDRIVTIFIQLLQNTLYTNEEDSTYVYKNVYQRGDMV